MSHARARAPAIHVPRRSLVRPDRDVWHYDLNRTDVRVYERGRNPSQGRLFSFPSSLRASYHSAGSAPIGLHYSGPRAAGFTREVFLTSRTIIGLNPYFFPAGVASVDVLMVGGGGGGLFGAASSFSDGGLETGGAGGGGIVVALGVVVIPAVQQYEILIGTGGAGGFDTLSGVTGGGPSFVRLGGGATIAGPAGGGGHAAFGPGVGQPGQPGGASNGSGGGGYYNWLDEILIGPGAGNGAGFAGSAGAGVGVGAGGSGVESAGGGGGGAGGVGTAGVAGALGNPGVPGDGGPGAVPPPSSFGAWGADIGEGGVFGGGGPGRNNDAAWARGAFGVGGGAANTGGGGAADASPSMVGLPGFSGIVVFAYATP